jgi:hemolysin III
MNHRQSGEVVVPEQHVSHTPVSRAIYGLITVLAVLQIMEVHPPSAWHGTVTLFGTTLAVALAEAYSTSIAEMLSAQRWLSPDDLRGIARDVRPILVGAQGPTVLLLLSAFGLISVELAIILAQVVAFLLLFGYGWRVGHLLHENRLRQLASGLLLVAIGGLAVGIKAAFH